MVYEYLEAGLPSVKAVKGEAEIGAWEIAAGCGRTGDLATQFRSRSLQNCLLPWGYMRGFYPGVESTGQPVSSV